MRTNEELEQLLRMTLADKITMSKVRIVEFYEHYDGNVVVSFSGGKDSTVLLHLVRSLFPDVKGVFCDTGLEYPEVKEHVKQTENVEIIRPTMSFREVIHEYGWVYPGKEVAQKIEKAREGKKWALACIDGKNYDGTPNEYRSSHYLKWKFLLEAPVKISSKCCDFMKKKPFIAYKKQHKCGFLIGTMTVESQLRRRAWLQNGCNVFSKGKSMPLSFWTNQDVLQYILDNDLKIPKVYGDIVRDKKGTLITTKMDRTGCMFCPIGVHHDKGLNRYQLMAKTHPKIYDYCINQLGLKDLLDYVRVDYKLHDKQFNSFDEVQPCRE